ncbi:MAG: cation:proton antiporter [Planctomycetota bacterium]|nr:cation:proton antiporter [Planctomycetota bacterium]
MGGVFAQWLSRLVKLPAIIPLLILGMLLGPEGPEWLRLMPRPGEAMPRTLQAIVGLGVAVILFEGGLSLNLRDLRLAPVTVRNLITLGALVSYAGGTLCAYALAGFEWSTAFLYGALMIVTGPTVIVPLLKNVRVKRRVHTILLWEGILIDAIGAITAVVTLEVVLREAGFFKATRGFVGAILIGPLIGAAGAWLLSRWLMWRRRRGKYDEELDPLLALAGALGLFGLSETLFHESGLGAVTCGGLLVSNMLGREVEELRRFKGTITTLLVSVLFMLLAANFRLETLIPLWPMGFVAIGVMMLVVRPLNILLCTRGTPIGWREKIFLSWIGPRGIVAASVASLFALLLAEHGDPVAGERLVALTFSTILITCLLNGFTAKPLAKLLKLEVARPEGLLIVGANELALRVAGLFENRGVPTIMVDTNPLVCKRAREAGFEVLEGNALDDEFMEDKDLGGFGRILAVTPSSHVNARACSHLTSRLGLSDPHGIVGPMGGEDARRQLEENGSRTAFSEHVDIVEVGRLLRAGRVHLRGHRADGQGKLPAQKHLFLPLASEIDGKLELYGYGTEIPPRCEVIGLEFEDLAGAAAPFKPLEAPPEEKPDLEAHSPAP